MKYPFGSVFSEEIVQGVKRKKIVEDIDTNKIDLNIRYFFIFAILIFGLGILLARLFALSVIEGERYKDLASSNRIREKDIKAPRGIIYDRNGEVLVRNIPIFTSPKKQVFFERKPASASGVYTEDIAREYPFGPILAHVLGYTGEVREADLRDKNNLLSAGDIIGKTGIEQYYDKVLRGKNGKELIEVDALGNTVRVLGRMEPKSGFPLTLSLDIDLQKILGNLFADKKGAAVVLNPKTGEVYGLYSSPSFDPNAIIRQESIENIFENINQPLYNRAVAGEYPPGSTFKIVTSLAALSSGAIDKNTKFEDTGILQVGSFSFGNWYFLQYGRKEGMIDLIGAIRRSNDIFFYKTGEATGIETIASYAAKVGIGSTLGIDIPGEAKGLMPDPQWQKKIKGEDWYLGNTYHVAIGQGDILATPLQINAWTNVIANGGKLCRPHLIKNQNANIPGLVEHGAGKMQNENCKDLNIKKEYIDMIKEGMKEACSPGGTGWPLFNFKVKSARLPDGQEKLKVDGVDFLESFESTTSAKPMVEIPVACKTGTAEYGDPKNRTHALFTVFAPLNNPQISVTVVVEGGGEGSSIAAPIAKEVLAKWFGK